MDRLGPYWQLRPIGGGREWDVPDDAVDWPTGTLQTCDHPVIVVIDGKKHCGKCGRQIYL